MPWEDPNNWPTGPFLTPLIAAIIAALRIIHDDIGVRWPRVLLESCLCGLIAISGAYVVDAMGVHGDWKVPIGAVIGLFGVDWVRQFAKKILDKKVDK